MFSRVFYRNESEAVPCKGKGMVSHICQPPLDGAVSARMEFPIEDPDFVWTAGLVAEDTSADSEGQMAQIFRQYERILAERSLTVADNCLRTWIFVRDIDNNYSGVVKGRRDYFKTIGLTENTHYIASTGINGSVADKKVLVTMDALAVKNIDKSKVQYLKALDHLNPTHEYGVTFERGVKFQHSGQNIVFISGTASIDSRGNVLYEGDVSRQTSRALANIRALLADGGTTMETVGNVIVYLRNASDAEAVRAVLAEELGNIDYVMVQAPVCRPAWLVELECMARF